MKKIIFILLLFISNKALSQVDFQENLNGFKLGQLRICTTDEFGKPIEKDKFSDGFEYELFLLRPDTSLYMIFEYPNYNLKIIWSIQIFGSNYDPQFLNLKLGDSEKEVIKKIGKPDSIIDVEEYGERWEYKNRNYSFEIDPSGKLASIKIMDKSDIFFPKIEPEKEPSLSTIISTICSNNRKALLDFIAPDLELYKNDSTYSMKYSFINEINNDRSGIFSNIFESAKDLSRVQAKDTLDYRFNIRVVEGMSPLWVIKFSDKHKIEELVFKYQFGRYLLWETQLRKK